MPKSPQALDRIDRRILYELDRDCRQPFSAIGEAIRKSPQYVKYRVGRLRDAQAIQAVTVLMPFPRGTLEAYAFITLKGSDVVGERMLLDHLFKLPETYRLYSCDGTRDIIASFVTRDPARLNAIKAELIAAFPNIGTILFNAVTGSEAYQKKYLRQPCEPERIMLPRDAEEPDELARRAVQELQRNPFATLLEMSRALGVSYDRVKYLFRAGPPYAGTRLVLSGRTVRKAVLLVDAAGDAGQVREHAALHPNVVQVDTLLGEHQLALYFECLPQEELPRIIKEFLYRLKDAVRGHLRLDILQTYKYQWTP
jgi:DNA-binding Lrp family transcriptional regulator